jgi:hypothetical protein
MNKIGNSIDLLHALDGADAMDDPEKYWAIG